MGGMNDVRGSTRVTVGKEMGVRMRRFAFVPMLMLAGVLILVAVLWTWSRLQPLAPAQREAVALLQPSPATEGRNAFAALCLLGRGVRETRLGPAVAAGLQRKYGHM